MVADGPDRPGDHWPVDWGDGSAVETYPAGTTTVSHVFLPGIDTAVVDVAAGTADGTTLVVTPPPVAVDLVPSAPTGLTATAYSPTEVDLAWTDASQDADGYSVLRSTDGGVTFQTVAEVGATAASYADTTLDASAAAPYAAQYQVRATGVSAAVASAAATAAVPANPTYVYQGGMPTLSVAAGPAGSNSAVVTWTYADNDDQGFELEMYDEQSPDNYQLIATPGPVGPSHAASTTVTGLTPGDTYDFRMRADHVGGTASRYTLPAILSPAATPAPTLAVSTYDLGAGDEEVRVGWSGVPTDGSVQIQVTGDGYAGEQWHPIAFNDDGSQSFPATGTSGYAAKGVTSGLEGYVDGYGMVWFGWPGVHTYRLRGAVDAAGDVTAWTQPQSVDYKVSVPVGGPLDVGLAATATTVTVSYQGPLAGFGESQVFLQPLDRPGYTVGDSFGSDGGYVGAGSGVEPQQVKTLTGLRPGTTYAVCVCTSEYHGGGLYEYFRTGQATITTPGGTDLAPPAAPAKLHAVDLGNGKTTANVELIWQNTSNNEDGFIVQRSPSPDFLFDESDFRVGADVTNFIDSLPVPSRQLTTPPVGNPPPLEIGEPALPMYYYRVMAIRGKYLSPFHSDIN